ncbi:MAG: ArnT family glycosyltransferase [Armatimonadota bacterium]
MTVQGASDNGRVLAWRWLGLIAIVAIYVGLAVAQSYATRLQWGPDEPAHIIYVRSLATDLRFPALTHGEEDNAYLPGAARTHEAHQPPLYYALAAVVWRACARMPDQTVSYRDRQSGELRGFSVPGQVRAVRLLSVLFGAVTLVFAWAMARTAFPGRPELWLVAAGLIGFTPMFTYLSGVINNDSLLALIFAATGWHWAKLLRFGTGLREAVVAGLLVGVALDVKETALGFVAVMLVVLAVAPGRMDRGQRAKQMAIALAIAGAVGGWWLARKWLVYGSPFVYPFVYPLLGLPAQERAALAGALPRQVFLFSFIPLDVIQAHVDIGALLRFFGGLAVLSAGGLVIWFARRKSAPAPRFETAAIAVWLLASLVVLAGLVRNVLTVDWRMGTSGGRYLVSVMPLLAPVAARGLSALFGDGRWAKVVLAAALLGLLAVNLLVIRATALEYGTL